MALVTGAAGVSTKPSHNSWPTKGDRCIDGRTAQPDPKYVGSLEQTQRSPGQGRAVAMADLSDPADRDRLFAEAVAQVGRPTSWSTTPPLTFYRPLDTFPSGGCGSCWRCTCWRPLHLTQLAIPPLQERSQGWVLNVTSVGGDLPAGPPFSGFDRTAGFRRLWNRESGAEPDDETLRRELFDDGIAVNAAAPTIGRHPGAGTLDLARPIPGTSG